jgi:cyclophilin family peptidyl-prolyl cis-trans isomerase
MVQTGDPTGTGKGGQSIWGKPFPDEIRSTLKVRWSIRSGPVQSDAPG